MYTGFCKDYPIVTIEDPFDQDDWDATAAFTAEGVCQVRSNILELHGSPASSMLTAVLVWYPCQQGCNSGGLIFTGAMVWKRTYIWKPCPGIQPFRGEKGGTSLISLRKLH